MRIHHIQYFNVLLGKSVNIAIYEFIDGRQWSVHYTDIADFDEKAFIRKIIEDIKSEPIDVSE